MGKPSESEMAIKTKRGKRTNKTNAAGSDLHVSLIRQTAKGPEMDNTKLYVMADRYRSLQEQKKDLEARLKELGAKISDLDTQLSDAMAEAEVGHFSRNGATFYLRTRLFASPAYGRKDEMIRLLKANGFGGIVTETVNAATLASFIREHREATGKDIPEWLGETVTTYEKVSVIIRNS